MNIFVNGESKEIKTRLSLEALISMLGFQNKKVAVELNEEIIPARLYASTMIENNDRLEIVHAIGGG